MIDAGSETVYYYIIDMGEFHLVKVLSIYELKRCIVQAEDPRYEYFDLNNLCLVAADLDSYSEHFF